MWGNMMSGNRYDLTFPENNIYLVEKFNDGTAINTIAGLLQIKFKFNEKICNKIINKLIESNDALRIKVYEEDNSVYQVVEEYVYEDIEYIDMSDKIQDEIQNYFRDNVNIPFDFIGNKLYNAKIVRYNENSGCIFIKLHHIVSDAWTFGQIANQLLKMYNDSLDNVNEENIIPSYIEFIEAEKEYISSEKYSKDQEFWREYLKDIHSPISLKETNLKVSTNANRYSVILDKEINDKIMEYSKVNRVSPYTLFLGALTTYIYRIKNENDFVIGTPILNRSNFKEKQMMGMFISTMPIRMKVDEDIKFLDLVKQIGSDTMSLFRHQKYPITKTLEHIHNTTDIKGKIYNVILSYQNARSNILGSEFFSTEWIFSGHIQDDLEINIMDIDNSGILNIHYDYLANLFEPIEIEYLHSRFMAIIQNAIEDIDVNVDNIRIMSKEEEDKILYEFNDTDIEYPREKNIVDLFEEQVNKYPDNIAIIFGSKQMTYKELNEKANSLAYYLREEKKLKPGDIVSLFLTRSFEMIISILGVLKSGAAYLPIDTEFPKDRTQYILENSKSKLLITNQNNFANDIETLNINNFDYSNYKNINMPNVNKGEDLIYVIYTSGTTGRPKGVMISHSNIINLVHAVADYQDLYEYRNFACFSTYSFDIFILETFIPFTIGAKVILTNEDEQKFPNLMYEFLKRNKIEILNITPSRMKLLLDSKNYDSLISLRRVMLGGEIFPTQYYNILRKYSNALIYDGYGPTEITVWSSAKLIEDENNINIGQSLPNVKSYVLDNKHRLLPLMTEGELCIGGKGVAIGYINNIDMTHLKFINTFMGRIYKTGDLVKYDYSGDMHYIGRLDSQIKLNGLRIEVEEIEYLIRSFEGISQACVIINTNNLLCAYITSNESIDINKLENYLYKKLPKYMVPKLIKQIDKFELNALGKVDKTKLSEIHNTSVKYEEPLTDIQKIIEKCLCEVLETEKIGIDDDFFEIGLDSLIAIKLTTLLASKGIRIKLDSIFKNSTIRKLGHDIENAHEDELLNKISNYDYSNIDFQLQNNTKENINKRIKMKKLGNVLLTGATGFLGAHILDSYIKNEKGKIYCLVRQKGNTGAKDRVIETLRFYFGSKYDNYINKRIFIVEGDITNENIFSNTVNNKKIIRKIQTVINSAAHVKHYGDEKKFVETNDTGARNIADFCLKNKKNLIHISTLSVSGNMLESGYIAQDKIVDKINYDETSMYINQKLTNIYSNTKFTSERYIIELINKGLKAKIMRMGNLSSRYSDGKFQQNVEENAFTNRIKTLTKIKVLPENLFKFDVEFSPVDYSSDAIIKLAKIDYKYNMFHLFNHNHITMKDLSGTFKNLGIEIKFLPKEEFSEKINEYIHDKNKSIDIEGIILDLGKDNSLNYTTNVTIKSDYTIELLKKIGFEWPIIDNEYITKHMKYLKDVKYIDYEG